jgi:CDP-paratose synthetase
LPKQSNKNILLTGATGFLGSHLLRSFLHKGWSVSIIKRSFSNTQRIQDLLPRVATLDIDTEPLESIFEQCGPFDAVVHTATSFGRNNETAGQVMAANLVFPLKLLETATFFNTTTFFNTATILYAYLNSYALSKRQFEEWGKVFSNQEKIGFVNLKLEHMYGPGDDASKFTTFIFESLKNNVPQIELTPGEQKRDFIYIDDVVAAYVILLEKQVKDAVFSEYEIGSGKAVSIRKFVEIVKEIAGSKTKLLFGAREYREHEIMFSQAGIKKLQETGWQPKVSLDQGILKSLQE